LSNLPGIRSVLFLMAGTLACGAPEGDAPLDNTTLATSLDPTNPRILGLVAHFEAHGIQLVPDRTGWWRVTHPASPSFQVIVSVRAFPERATAGQLQEALTRINLAYLLNSRTRLAMSYPSWRGAGSEVAKDASFLHLKTELERLFHEY
jgi:hypothetical protein